MRKLLTILCLLALWIPRYAHSFTTDADILTPAVDGDVHDAEKRPVFNAVITAVSVDPGRTFRYYMVSDFNGWLFIDCSDSLQTGYRGGFMVHGFKKDVGNCLRYGITPNIKLYGDKSLRMDNTVQYPDIINSPEPPPGFYIGCWKNTVLNRYDIVVYNPTSLVDTPDKIISITGGTGTSGEICRCRKSLFFHYRPEATDTGFTVRASGRGSDGTLYDRSFTFAADCDYFNTGFISQTGGVVCIGKDDPARLEVPPGAYTGEGVIPVTVSRTKDPGNGTVYEIQPALEFKKAISFIIKTSGKSTIESWDAHTNSWVSCESLTSDADGTVRIRTRRTGRIRVHPDR